MTLRLVLALTVLFGPALAAEDQINRTAGLQKVQRAAEAEVLATACGFRLNEHLRDALRSDALLMIDPSDFDSMEQFARAYTLSIVHRHRRAVCARALTQFGPDGEQVRDLISPH